MDHISNIVAILVIIFAGSFIQGSAGFGFGLLSMGLLPHFLPVKTSTFVVLSLTTFMSAQILFKYWRYIRFRQLVPLLAATFAGRFAAYLFVVEFGDTSWMRKWLGLVLILMVAVLFLMSRKPQMNLPSWLRGKAAGAAVGMFAGFTGGAFAVGGPFYVLYLLSLCADKREYNASLQMIFLVTNVFSLSMYGFHGDLDATFWYGTAVGTIAVFSGVYLGLKWFHRLPANRIVQLSSVLVLLSGLSMLIH